MILFDSMEGKQNYLVFLVECPYEVLDVLSAPRAFLRGIIINFINGFFIFNSIVCQKFVEKGSTGDASCLPFITGFLSCGLWLRYGFLTQEESIILVNTIGATLFLAYSITYLCYCIKKVSLIHIHS